MVKKKKTSAIIQKILVVFLFSSILLMPSCKKEDDYISRRYPCRFQFNGELHPTSIILSACKSPGSYVYVYSKIENNGVRHVYAQSNDGKTPTEDNIISTDKEANYSAYILGASNEIGLIIGCTNFNGLVAYDRICPNCSSKQALAWTKENKQKVVCNKCKRTYELETSSLVSGDDGDGLLRYGCSFNGTMLSVGN